MDRYLFMYESGHKEYHEVEDIFHFNQLLSEIDINFKQLFKWDYINYEWKEVVR